MTPSLSYRARRAWAASRSLMTARTCSSSTSTTASSTATTPRRRPLRRRRPSTPSRTRVVRRPGTGAPSASACRTASATSAACAPASPRGSSRTCARWSCPSTSPPERSARRCWISRWTTRVSPPLAVAHATARAGSPGPTPSRPPRTDRPARAIWPNQNRSWARSVSRPTAPCCWPSATASATAPRPVPRPTHPPTSCQAVTWTRHAWRAGCT